MQKPSVGFSFTTGAVLGIFLASFGLASYLNNNYPQPEVKVVTVTKTNTRTVTVDRPVIVEKQVFVEKRVQEHKLYRASLLDEKGNVTESWEVTKAKFIVIGAQLTDKSGKTFQVTGQIKIEPIK